MTGLATDPALLSDVYDVLIVGSGYGGAITAARLGFANHQAGGKLRLAVLERGIEHPVGSGPEDETALIMQLRTKANPLGFYDQLPGDTIDVIQGCGLGGTSLNNMNAAVVPDREVFLDASSLNRVGRCRIAVRVGWAGSGSCEMSICFSRRLGWWRRGVSWSPPLMPISAGLSCASISSGALRSLVLSAPPRAARSTTPRPRHGGIWTSLSTRLTSRRGFRGCAARSTAFVR